MVPLGLAMPIGLVVIRLLSTCAVTVQKCAVLPLSAMAVKLGGMLMGGGPTKTVEKLEPESLVTLDWGTVLSRVAAVGSPHCQLVDGGRWRGRPDAMVLLPPRMRKAVASSLWPSALCKHVMDV